MQQSLSNPCQFDLSPTDLDNEKKIKLTQCLTPTHHGSTSPSSEGSTSQQGLQEDRELGEEWLGHHSCPSFSYSSQLL